MPETRSKTGNARPRVFAVVDTNPTVTRKRTTKKKAAPAKASKPTGVTKKRAPAKKPTTKVSFDLWAAESLWEPLL